MSVSIQQAAINAIVAYLSTQMPDVQVQKRWPSRDLPSSKVITVITAGAPKDIAQEPRVLSNTPVPDTTNTTSVWQVAERQQPLQMDVWCKVQSDRDDILARLDQFLRAGFAPISTRFNRDPFENGFYVLVQDGWDAFNTSAYCRFQNPDFFDNADSVSMSLYRATYRGDVWAKLAFSTTGPRQKKIILRNQSATEFTKTLENP